MHKALVTLKSRIFRIIITIVLLLFIISKFEINTLVLFQKITKYEYLLLALLLSILVRPIISNLRWKIFLKFSRCNMPLIDLIKISYSANFYGVFLPSGQASDGFRIYMIEKKYPERRGYSGGTVIADRMIGFIVFCSMACIGSFFLPDDTSMIKTKLIIYLCAIMFVVFTFFVINKSIYRFISKLINKISFFKGIFTYIDKLHKSLTETPYRKIIPRVLPLIVIFQLSNILIVYSIFSGFGYKMPFYYPLAFVPVIQVITILPISIANIGFREGLFIYFFKMINIPEGISFSVSLTYFLITGFVSTIIGGLIVLSEGIRFKEKTTSKS